MTTAVFASNASIFIGVHGNQLSWSLFMEPKTIVIELNPVGQVYKWQTEISDITHMILNVDVQKINTDQLESKILEAVNLWNKR